MLKLYIDFFFFEFLAVKNVLESFQKGSWELKFFHVVLSKCFIFYNAHLLHSHGKSVLNWKYYSYILLRLLLLYRRKIVIGLLNTSYVMTWKFWKICLGMYSLNLFARDKSNELKHIIFENFITQEVFRLVVDKM